MPITRRRTVQRAWLPAIVLLLATTPAPATSAYAPAAPAARAADRVQSQPTEPAPAVASPASASAVSVGYKTACAAMADGHARCWGNSVAGAGDPVLGDGALVGSTVPTTVSGVTDVAQVRAPYTYGSNLSAGCLRRTTGQVLCWGGDYRGTNGTGGGGAVNTATAILGGATYSDLSTSYGLVCAVESGKVACWGGNDNGQLGQGTTDGLDHGTPGYVSSITTAVQVATGASFACALLADQTVWCWGSNWYGELGNHGTTASSVPVQVADVSGAVEISASGDYNAACARLSGGTVKCWGSDTFGKLGDGPGSPAAGYAAQVSGIGDAVEVAMGGYNACARLSTGGVSCWGYGPTVGIAAWTSLTDYTAYVPVAVDGIGTAVSVSAGMDSSCAVLADTTTWCWGDNTGGKLGDGTTTAATSPVQVAMVGDTTKPVIGRAPWIVPQTGWPLTTAALTSSIRVVVHWTGSDPVGPGSGIDHYKLERSTDGGLTWRILSSTIPDAGADTTLVAVTPSSGTVQFRVTAYDHAKNASLSAKSPLMTGRIVQQSAAAAVYRGTWASKAVTGDSGGSDKRTSAKGASVSFTFSGRAMAVVFFRSTNTGDCDVYVDGKHQAAPISTTAGSDRPRFVTWTKRWASVGTHTIKLVNRASTGWPVLAVDAFVVIK